MFSMKDYSNQVVVVKTLRYIDIRSKTWHTNVYVLKLLCVDCLSHHPMHTQTAI